MPVLLAALAAVPATFLSMLEGSPARVGEAVNWLSLGVLTAESVVLLALASDRRGWLRTHRLPLLVALATIPAVVLALGPVQVVRLVRFAGALRIARVGRILRAGRVLRRRLGPDHPLARAVVAGMSVVTAAFVALVLADPTSQTRQLVNGVLGRYGALPPLIAGTIVAAATFVAARRRPRFRRRMAPQPLPPSGAAGADGRPATTTAGGKAWD